MWNVRLSSEKRKNNNMNKIKELISFKSPVLSLIKSICVPRDVSILLLICIIVNIFVLHSSEQFWINTNKDLTFDNDTTTNQSRKDRSIIVINKRLLTITKKCPNLNCKNIKDKDPGDKSSPSHMVEEASVTHLELFANFH